MSYLCECGCGGVTEIIKDNDKTRSRVKGNHYRFLYGHNRKSKRKNGDGKGYISKFIPMHPHSGHNGLVYEHTLVAERILGKFLQSNAVVHHIDKDKSNNNSNNLVICENASYHSSLHARQKALEECGHASWRKCCRCHVYDDPENLHILPSGKQAYHNECNTKHHRKYL